MGNCFDAGEAQMVTACHRLLNESGFVRTHNSGFENYTTAQEKTLVSQGKL